MPGTRVPGTHPRYPSRTGPGWVPEPGPGTGFRNPVPGTHPDGYPDRVLGTQDPRSGILGTQGWGYGYPYPGYGYPYPGYGYPYPGYGYGYGMVYHTMVYHTMVWYTILWYGIPYHRYGIPLGYPYPRVWPGWPGEAPGQTWLSTPSLQDGLRLDHIPFLRVLRRSRIRPTRVCGPRRCAVWNPLP